MTTATPLSTIIALARAGALDHAWAQYCGAGYDKAEADPAALTVRGRLLKDHALRATGEARRTYYLRSAEAYRQAAALQPATYPLINAATLSLLSGDRGQAEEIAHEVLARVAAEPDEPETPYYRAATEAEALLLIGRRDGARSALAAAVAAAPRAWEDHGSTLRQFVAIEDELGGDPAWLDMLRPPRILVLVRARRRCRDRGRPCRRPDFGPAGRLRLRPARERRGPCAWPKRCWRGASSCIWSCRRRWTSCRCPGARADAVLAAAESVIQVRPADGAPDARRTVLAAGSRAAPHC